MTESTDINTSISSMRTKEEVVLGIDIGASGIKSALVNVKTGLLVSERLRIPTPQPATPEKMAKAVKKTVKHFNWDGSIGCGFPAIVKNGIALSAANIDKSWIGTDIEQCFSAATGCPVCSLNDADAAGLAEVQFGKGRNQKGVVMLITIGSGLGSAVFINGKLLPNTELGHLYLQGEAQVAEKAASANAKKRDAIDWEEWGQRFNRYLQHLERLFSPNLIILGGGASKKFDKFKTQIDIRAEIIPASFLNNAGIIGAAAYAKQYTYKNPTI